jgi:NAD(P)-dependent dehydrogenase (short-subunit alcohol dehydrogenase family)
MNVIPVEVFSMRVFVNGGSYHVILACRSEARATSAIATLKAETGSPNISFLQVDLASLSSVRPRRRLVSSSPHIPIDGLVNAGIGATAADGTQTSIDGCELIFATNHLGHFLLANLIRPNLAADCRVAVVSSNLHNILSAMTGGVPISYPGAAALAAPHAAVLRPIIHYAQSKLCNIYFARELARHLAGTDRTVRTGRRSDKSGSDVHSATIAAGATGGGSDIKKVLSGRIIRFCASGEKLAADAFEPTELRP